MTTGQPIRVPSDRDKYNNEFMENLKLQIKLNDQNLQANRLFINTGQLPASTQMADTRSTSEKLADIESLKKSIVSDLSAIAEPSFAYAIIQGVLSSPLNVDNSLFRYLAQNAQQLALQLSKKYKFGIAGDANDVEIIISFLEDAYNKTKSNFQSIKSYMQSNTGIPSKGNILSVNNTDGIIAELRDIEKRIDYFIKRAPQIGIRPIQPLFNIIRQILYVLPTSEQLNQIIINIENLPPGSSTEIFYTTLDILKNLPKLTSLQTLVDKLEQGYYKNDMRLITTVSENFINLFSTFLKPENQDILNHFRRQFINSANAEIRETSRVNRINEIGTINAERAARDQNLKAQRVYVINPDNDPVKIENIMNSGNNPISSIPNVKLSNSAQPVSLNPTNSGNIPDYNSEFTGASEYSDFGSADFEGLPKDRENLSINMSNASNPSKQSDETVYFGNLDNNQDREQQFADIMDHHYEEIERSPLLQGDKKIMTNYLEGTAEEFYTAQKTPQEFDINFRKFAHDYINKHHGKDDNEQAYTDLMNIHHDEIIKSPLTKNQKNYLLDYLEKTAAEYKRKNKSPGEFDYHFKEYAQDYVDTTPKAKKGRGISSDYRDFGINKINHKKLDDGILTLRRKSNTNIPDMPSKRISRKLQKIIKHISGGGVPDYNDIQNLEDTEKDYLHKLISKSNLQERLSVPAPSKDQEEKDFHQFEVMKGELMSGNDSTELVKKFKILILKLSKQNLLPKNEVNELLTDLLQLGY